MDYMVLQITPNMKIQEALKNIDYEIYESDITKQRRRFLESYKEDLESYLNRNPNKTEVPTAFELFCDSNPHAPECLTYDL